MDITALKEEVISILNAFNLSNYKELSLTGGSSYQFCIKTFGIVLCVLNIEEVLVVRNKVSETYKGWRIFYITPDDDLVYKKDELLFELIRCGYIKWLRLAYPRIFNNAVKLSDLGNKIIRKRLELWADQEKYRFLIEDNQDALKHPTSYVLTLDPGFFDYMPEIY